MDSTGTRAVSNGAPAPRQVHAEPATRRCDARRERARTRREPELTVSVCPKLATGDGEPAETGDDLETPGLLRRSTGRPCLVWCHVWLASSAAASARQVPLPSGFSGEMLRSCRRRTSAVACRPDECCFITVFLSCPGSRTGTWAFTAL
jgi:hypothetical protein